MMNPLKIAMLSSYYFPHKGGTERYVHDLSHALAKRGHEVTIFSHYPGPAGQYETEPVRVVRVPSLWGPFYSPYLAWLPESQLRRQDIMHSHAPPFYFTNQVSRIKKIPHILTYHCDIEIPEQLGVFKLPGKSKHLLDTYFRKTTEIHLKKVDQIVATTHSYAETSPLLRNYPYRVIPLGIHVERFRKAMEQPEIQKIQRNEREILYVGRLVASKGLVFLIEAAKLLRDAGESFTLTIVGTGEDLLSLKLLVHTYDLEKQVYFAGKVEDNELLHYYKRAAVLVLPSFVRLEAFGIVQLEALAMGTPVIVSDIPGVNEVVRKSQGGYLVPPRDPPALADQLAQALRNPRELRYRAEQGQAYVFSHYDWNTIAGQFEELYYETLQRKGKSL
ncbi:MAG TPA: glycosyltransferase family 4 protein [Termitinemataceae bacterium]|nr:glycosyltransferase family 4 protein [Termitinemataceae bacterium]HOM24536.1 glycosyltransferase family 4 protein [Termitinemataceae bacterium]